MATTAARRSIVLLTTLDASQARAIHNRVVDALSAAGLEQDYAVDVREERAGFVVSLHHEDAEFVALHAVLRAVLVAQ